MLKKVKKTPFLKIIDYHRLYCQDKMLYIYMNAVILGSKVNVEQTQATYICLYILGSTCRTDFIQSALDRTVSRESNALFPNVFGPFFTSLDDFEVARHVKTHRNSNIDLAFIHVSF